MRSCKACNKVKEDTLIVGRNEFVLFMVEVINCLAQTDKKTERVKIIVKAAEQFLGIRGLIWEVEECSHSQPWGDASSL